MMDTLFAQIQIDSLLANSAWLEPWGKRWIDETVCSMLVGTACGVLGCFVVLRRMAMIGDALSHAVLPGVVVAFILSGSTGALGLLFGALVAGVVTAVLINLVGRFTRTKEDSAIGIVFTALFALGIILISALPRGTHFDLRCFLFGDPLAVGKSDLWMMAIICPSVIGVVALMYHRLKIVSFDPLVAAAMGISVAAAHYLLMGMLSATIVAGLKTTGVILVVAMVITPASAAYQLTNRFAIMLILAGLFGAISAGAGMSVAFVTNWPTGPAMVLVAALIFLVSVLGSPANGVVFHQIRQRRLAQHVANEDVLKAMYLHGPAPMRDLASQTLPRMGLRRRAIRSALRRLKREGLIALRDGSLALTDDGRTHAEKLVRAHRLWESYLVDQVGLDPAVVHAEAERLEHAHGLTEQIDVTMGHRARDPHGSVIPRQDGDGSNRGGAVP
ncbi:MAG: metal ABC transporter permease [Phycisphaerae bacterium]|nr:metal ABC transporter permease [Phycisphaerae bacterium]